VATPKLTLTNATLDQYFKDINRYKLLTREQEFELAVRLRENNDTGAAKDLVTANLRFVVKVAFEYRKYQMNMVDLIQEGNVGLMTAVQKFDPYRGFRLISYAVWWIKAYIQNFILRTWSMVKLGTTAEQRKMLFGARKGVTEPEDEGEAVSVAPAIASRSTSDLMGLSAKVAHRDFSLDTTLDETARVAYVDMLNGGEDIQDDSLGREEVRTIVRQRIDKVSRTLNERERTILRQRLLADEPLTLQEIGAKFGITRERTRQIESALKKKIAALMPEFAGDSAEVQSVL
jgi:RNA polymerase sigma-32 factor